MVSVLIEHADGRKFLRHGECDGCVGREVAACCTFIALPLVRKLSADEQRWVELHPALDVVGQSIHYNVACSALEAGRCTLFGQQARPAMCERYPELPEQLLAGCAYTFEEVV